MRRTGVVVWREVALQLRRDIDANVFPSNERLPNEQKLAEQYGVNRHTLRQAIGSLVEQGILVVRQGKGTLLQQGGLDYPLTERTRFTENISKQNRVATGRLIRCDRVAAPEDIAKDLQIGTKTILLLLEVLHLSDGRPITLTEHYFPLPRFEGLDEFYRQTSSVTEAIARHGVKDYRRRITRLLSRMPTSREASLLKQPKSQPVVFVRAINVDEYDKPVELCISRFSAERVQFVIET